MRDRGRKADGMGAAKNGGQRTAGEPIANLFMGFPGTGAFRMNGAGRSPWFFCWPRRRIVGFVDATDDAKRMHNSCRRHDNPTKSAACSRWSAAAPGLQMGTVKKTDTQTAIAGTRGSGKQPRIARLWPAQATQVRDPKL